jgi:hypothetical protein
MQFLIEPRRIHKIDQSTLRRWRVSAITAAWRLYPITDWKKQGLNTSAMPKGPLICQKMCLVSHYSKLPFAE